MLSRQVWLYLLSQKKLDIRSNEFRETDKPGGRTVQPHTLGLSIASSPGIYLKSSTRAFLSSFTFYSSKSLVYVKLLSFLQIRVLLKSFTLEFLEEQFPPPFSFALQSRSLYSQFQTILLQEVMQLLYTLTVSSRTERFLEYKAPCFCHELNCARIRTTVWLCGGLISFALSICQGQHKLETFHFRNHTAF